MADIPFVAETDAGRITGHVGGAGAPLLLLHGGPGLTDYMDELAAEVHGWRAIRYQQRSLSPSSTDGPFTVQRHVADAVAVLDTLGVGRTIVAGHSWGGHLALHLAVAHPGRVAGLLLIDPLGVSGDGGVAATGEALSERLLPAAVPRYQEVADRLSGPAPSDGDALESLALLWPGYFAEPAAAPGIPPECPHITERICADVSLAGRAPGRRLAGTRPGRRRRAGHPPARRAEPDARQPGRPDRAVAAGRGGSHRSRSGASALARAARLRS